MILVQIYDFIQKSILEIKLDFRQFFFTNKDIKFNLLKPNAIVFKDHPRIDASRNSDFIFLSILFEPEPQRVLIFQERVRKFQN
jgi:hypothetical protein